MNNQCCDKCFERVFGNSPYSGKDICKNPNCPCHTQEPQSVPWEKEFDEKIMCHCEGDDFDSGHTISNPEIITSFIEKVIAQERQALVEKIEGMKKPALASGVNDCKHILNKKQLKLFGRDQCEKCYEWIHLDIEQNAINDVLTDLLEHLKK